MWVFKGGLNILNFCVTLLLIPFRSSLGKKNSTFSKEAKNYFNRKRNEYILKLNIKIKSDRTLIKKLLSFACWIHVSNKRSDAITSTEWGKDK